MRSMLARDAVLKLVLRNVMQVLRHALSRPEAFYATIDVLLAESRTRSRRSLFSYRQLTATMCMGCGFSKPSHVLALQPM